MANNYVVTDADLAPISSNAADYAITDADLASASTQSSIPASNLSPNSFVMPNVDYKGQLSSLGAFGAAIPKGLGELGMGTADIGKRLYNDFMLQPKNYQPVNDPFKYSPSSALGQLEAQHPTASGAGQLLGENIPLLVGNPSSLEGLAGGSAATNAALNPQSPLPAGIIGGLTGAVGGAVGKGLNYIGNAAGKALQNPVAEAAQRLGLQNLPLGEMTQNPSLKNFSQNQLTRLPFSGAANNYADVGSQLDEKVSGALDSFKPTTPVGQIPGNIQDTLQAAYNSAQNMKRSLYNAIGSRADEIGTGVIPNNYLNGLDDPTTGTHIPGVNDLLNQSADVLSRSPELKLSNGTQDFLQKISDASAAPKPFSEASLVMGKLNNFASQLGAQGNSYEAGLIRNLRPLLQNDMEQAAYNSGDPSLINEWQKAQQHYANEIAPFDDPNIEKYLQSGSKADNPDLLIPSFLKTGTNNQPTLLNNLLSKMPDSQKNDIGYYFLTRSLPRDDLGHPIINTNTVTKFNDSLQNYDPQIRNALIPPQIQQTLKDVSTVKKQIPDLLLNPPTGKQGADLNALGGLAALGGGPLLAGHPLLGAGLLGGTLAGGRAANSLLTSPGVRNALARGLPGNRIAQLLAASANPALNSLTRQ